MNFDFKRIYPILASMSLLESVLPLLSVSYLLFQSVRLDL